MALLALQSSEIDNVWNSKHSNGTDGDQHYDAVIVAVACNPINLRDCVDTAVIRSVETD